MTPITIDKLRLYATVGSMSFSKTVTPSGTRPDTVRDNQARLDMVLRYTDPASVRA
jgi:hypothetical protein